jgi:acetyl-CoA acetyltransferase
MASHQKAVSAIAAGKFKEETLPVEVKTTSLPTNENGSAAKGKPQKPSTQTVMF